MKKPRSRQRELKAEFDAAHAEGMAGLKSGNYGVLDDAIRRERAIIEEQAGLIDRQRRAFAEKKPLSTKRNTAKTRNRQA